MRNLEESKMDGKPVTTSPEWDLEDWEKAYTIHVGTIYACRTCKNLVMITRSGIGVLEMNCCGKSMEQMMPSSG